VHVWFTQGTGSPHVPLDVHFCAPLFPEHIVVFGPQLPAHIADPPADTHVAPDPHETAAPHVPLDEQVSTPVFSSVHCVLPGAHVPTHILLEHA
jgi:hypothetical protein